MSWTTHVVDERGVPSEKVRSAGLQACRAARRVLLQAEPQFRARPNDVDQFYVRTGAGDIVPLSTLVKVRAVSGPEVVYLNSGAPKDASRSSSASP